MQYLFVLIHIGHIHKFKFIVLLRQDNPEYHMW